MSYCVNCGVELAEGEKHCPLCNTEVMNPHVVWQEPEARPYPSVLEELMHRIDRRYLAALLTLGLLVPIIVTLLSDRLTSGRLSWSLYVLGALLLLEVWFVVPLLSKRFRRLTFLSMDSLAAMLYLYEIERIAGGEWFLPLALPILAVISVLLLSGVYVFRKGRGRHVLVRIAAFLGAAGTVALVTEAAVDSYVRGTVFMGWSLFVLTPCLILAVCLLIVENKNHLKEEILKRMFY